MTKKPLSKRPNLSLIYPPLLTQNNVAEILAVTTATLYRWHAQGHGPRGFRLGRGLRYTLEDFLAWQAGVDVTQTSDLGSDIKQPDPPGPAITSGEILSEEEAAECLCVDGGDLRAWRRRKNYGPNWFRAGGQIRYRREDVYEWKHNQR